MSKIFTNNMVLQRNIHLPIWGWTIPGKKVTVQFKGQKKKTVADANGKWLLKLDPLTGSIRPDKLIIITTAVKKEFKNVLVGDVWLCSGQSNMELSFNEAPEEALGIKDSSIRFINKLGSGWQTCNTKNLHDLSRVAYYFGAKLREELQIPIGLINISCGCSSIEAWMSPESFATNDFLKNELMEMEKFQKFYANYKHCTVNEKKRVFLAHCQKYTFTTQCYLENGKISVDKHDSILCHMTAIKPAFLYTSRIAQVIPFGIKGVIWYQGETNIDDDQYARKQQVLIESWRKLWKQGDFPFYIVQVAPYKDHKTLPDFWVQQYKAAHKTPNSGLISTVDIGDINEVHPKNKRDVGQRLALLALHKTYGQKDVVASGPTFKSMSIEDSKVVIDFNNTGSGLTTKDRRAPAWFEVAGDNKKFMKADAFIKDNKIILSNSFVKIPKYVRYAWSSKAHTNFCNKEELPAFPFNTEEPFFNHIEQRRIDL